MASVTNAPSAAYPTRQSHVSTMNVTVTGEIIPASETPIEPMASAQPRLAMNHLDTAALTTSAPKSVQPAKPVIAYSARKIQSSDWMLTPRKQSVVIAAPSSISGRGPCLSTTSPAMMPDTAPVAAAIDVASVNCHTCQPRSSTMGLRNTPTTAGPTAIQVNCPTRAAPTIHQP